jgi:hypothetical protein
MPLNQGSVNQGSVNQGSVNQGSINQGSIQAAQGSIYNPIIYYMSLIILDNIIYYYKNPAC